MWAAVSPWNKQHRPHRGEDEPRWPSLAAALRALLEHELGGRVRGSSIGAMLDRLRTGQTGGSRDPRHRFGREIMDASDVVHVQQGLELAFGAGCGGLSAPDCVVVLFERSAGVLAGVTSYELLAERFGIGEDALKGIVKHGRTVIGEELVRRGLIPARSRGRVRGAPVSATTWKNDADALAPVNDLEATA